MFVCVLDLSRGDGRDVVACVGLERVAVRNDVQNEKTRRRSMRRGPPWLGLADLSQAGGNLFFEILNHDYLGSQQGCRDSRCKKGAVFYTQCWASP